MVCSTRESSGRSPESPVARLDEQADLGLAEAVDGLHGIAHGEEAVAVAGLPAGGEAAQQVELGARGVLEFVHQDVAQAVVQGQGQVGGGLVRAQRQAGRER